MRFLTDQDVYQVTIELLKAKEVGLARAVDAEILARARAEQRILVTRDKGFGALVFLSRQETYGVILLRMEPTTIDAVHRELEKFLKMHAQMDLRNRFVVIEPSRHRIRVSAQIRP